MGIYIYAQDADNFDNAGLCGDLVLTKCEHEEEAGGKSVLSIAAAPDEWGKWKYIEDGCIIKAPVPVRTTPPMEGGSYVTQVVKCTVKPTSTVNRRGVYTKAVNGKRRATAKLDVEYIVVKNPAGSDRYGIKWGKGTGWIAKDAVDLGDAVTIPAAADGIESVAPAWSVRDQLFRVYDAERTDDGVTPKARHISFDLLGNLTTYETDEPVTLQTALDGILGGCDSDHDFEAFTDIDDTAAGVDSARKNPIDAFSDPEDGVIARWGAELVRDDYELYFLRRAGMNRGVRIEYGKNLKGVKCTISRDKLVTKILPVGETADGKPAYLSADPNKISTTVVPESYIVSPRDALYAAPHTVELPVSDAKITSKKKTGKEVTEALACERMRKAAQDMLDSGVDMPEINLEVDFLRLGDTEEYAQFAQLDDVYLYDTVRVVYKELGIDMDLDVVRVVYDCLTDRYSKIELGALKDRIVGMAGWQMPYGIDGGKIRYNSLGPGQLQDGFLSARHIQAEIIEAIHIAAQTITADKIATNGLYAQHVIAQLATIIQAAINKAQIGEAEIDWANIVDLNAVFSNLANVVIGDAQIDFAQIMDLVAQKAIITEGIGGKLYISRLAVTEGNIATLTVGELLVRGDDGHLYRIVPDGNGGATSTRMEVDGGDVMAHTITARELNVDAIFASEALIGKITAAHIASGVINTNHVTSDFGATLDLTGNKAIQLMVTGDTVRQIIADSTRELRVSYDGAGTHMTEDTDTTTMTAKVYEGGADITGTVPEAAFLWSRDSGDSEADAAWAVARAGMRQITVTKADVASRSIISCTLLSTGDIALSFAVDPVTMTLTVTDPEFGGDTATYDPATGILTVNGTGYTYDQPTQTITIDKGLSATRTTVQHTFSDETGIRARMLMLNDLIALIIEDDEGGSTGFKLTPGMAQTTARDIILTGRVTIGDLAPAAKEKLDEIEAAAHDANVLASTAQSSANSANNSASYVRGALVDLCTDYNMTMIKGSSVYAGSINTDQLFVNRIINLSDTSTYMKMTARTREYQFGDEIASLHSFGLDLYSNNSICGSVVASDGLVSSKGSRKVVSYQADDILMLQFGTASDNPSAVYFDPTGAGGVGAMMFFCALIPEINNEFDIGDANRRVRRIYSNNSLNTSDIRFKRDIAPLNAAWLLRKLEPIRYRLVESEEPGGKLRFGIKANGPGGVQDAIAGTDIADAHLLDASNPEHLNIDYTDMHGLHLEGWQEHDKAIAAQKRTTAAMIKAIANQDGIIAAQAKTIAAQQIEIDDIKSRLARLEQYLGVQ